MAAQGSSHLPDNLALTVALVAISRSRAPWLSAGCQRLAPCGSISASDPVSCFPLSSATPNLCPQVHCFSGHTPDPHDASAPLRAATQATVIPECNTLIFSSASPSLAAKVTWTSWRPLQKHRAAQAAGWDLPGSALSQASPTLCTPVLCESGAFTPHNLLRCYVLGVWASVSLSVKRSS